MELQRITSVPRLPARKADAHKGSFGRILVMGGSVGMIGAPSLSANGALRGGAGLVTVAVPAVIQQTAAGLCPCATSVPLACDADGSLADGAAQQVASAAEACDVLAVGPGMGAGGPQRDIVAAALAQTEPVVLDADGLNNLPAIDDWPDAGSCPLILTPHPGELARMTGATVEQIQADRESAAVDAARQWRRDTRAQLVVVLKGAATVVTDGRNVYVNDTGNPGMATGGTGDVLTGLIAALIGQHLPPLPAACLGVWAHGHAGDLAASHIGMVSLTAADLLDYLPAALQQ